MLKFIWFFTFSLFLSCYSYGLNIGDNVARVLDLSSSGQTIILDRVERMKFAKNELAYLLSKKSLKKTSGYLLAAKIKLIKQKTGGSVWTVIRKYSKIPLLKENRYLFFTQSQFLQGRVPLKIKRKEIIAAKKDYKQAIKEGMSPNGDSLAERKNRYIKGRALKKQSFDEDYNFKMVDLKKLDNISDETLAGRTLFLSPSAAEFNKKVGLIRFDRMMQAYVEKANGDAQDLDAFYFSQKKDELSGDIRDDSLARDTSQRISDEQRRREKNLRRIAREYKDRGVSWSDDLSDEELSEVLYNVGALREQQRREAISAHRFNHQVFATGGVAFTENQTSNGAALQGSTFSFGVEFESYILKKFKALNRYSLEFGLNYGKDYVSLGSSNGELSEISLNGYVNWYPFSPANILSRNIVFFSLGMRTGFSTISSNGSSSNYQSLVFPSFRAGIKYNFENSYGVRIMAIYDSVKTGQVSGAGSSLPDNVNYKNGRINFSISKFY